MVSGGMACVKYLLFLFNLIFAITGIVFIVVGALILAMYNDYSNFMDNWFFAAPVLMIVVGITVFLVSFFGCCGAVKEHHCMIITFSVLLLLIFAMELGAGICGYMMRNEVGRMLQTRLNNTMSLYTSDQKVHKSWDVLQHDFKCCGINGTSDWAVLFPNIELPNSCCHEMPLNQKCDSNSVTVSTEGCMKKLKSAIEDKAIILGAVGIGIALVQLIGVIFACCLARSIRREYETVETTAH
ncbi:CD63 antigen-like [Chelonus insularis]|uniref:CD63 antigen-like n=1 Tax=Chelonus insularis TaxID=460826 RepID=UPI00158A2624|nr:CD63 antigen-like [Chelonus insularis]